MSHNLKIFSIYLEYLCYSNLQEKPRFTARVNCLGNHKILKEVVISEKFPFIIPYS